MFDVEGRLLYANQQAREALVGMDLSEHAPDLMPRLAALGGRLRPLAGGRARAGRGDVHSRASKGPRRWRRGKRRLSSRHSTRTTGSSRRRPSTWASAGPPSGAVSRRMGYTETAGANGRKPPSVVVVRRRPPDSSTRHRLTLHQSRRPAASSSAPWPAAARAIPPSPTTRRRIRYRLSVGDRPARLVEGAAGRGGGAGGAGPVAAAQRSPDRRDRAALPGRAAGISSCRASGTGPGSCPAGWTTRSASSATTFPPPAPCIRSPRAVPTWYRYALTGDLTVDARPAAARSGCSGSR